MGEKKKKEQFWIFRKEKQNRLCVCVDHPLCDGRIKSRSNLSTTRVCALGRPQRVVWTGQTAHKLFDISFFHTHTHSVQSYFELLVQLRPSVRSRRSRVVLMDVVFFLFNSPRSSFLLFLIYFLTLQNSFPFFLFMTLEAVYFQSMASFRCLPQQQLFKQFSNRKKMRRSCLFNFLISSQEVKKKKSIVCYPINCSDGIV